MWAGDARGARGAREQGVQERGGVGEVSRCGGGVAVRVVHNGWWLGLCKGVAWMAATEALVWSAPWHIRIFHGAGQVVTGIILLCVYCAICWVIC